MSTISNELVKDLRMAFAVWQQDYDPVEDKEQYEMFGLGVVAMDELLALRKERELAEPVEHESHIRREVNVGGNTWVQCSAQAFERERARGAICRVLYESPPAPVVPAAYEIDSNATDYHRGWNSCRATMLQSGNDEIGSWSNHKTTPTDKPKSEMSQQAERLLRDTTALAVTLSAETDTTSQQFESLAGKSVGEDASSMADAHMAWLNTNFPRNAYSDEEWEEVSLYTWLAWRDSQRNACFPGT
ncbi:hypothetical protein ACMWZV_002060 [Cronobacter sakazakii]